MGLSAQKKNRAVSSVQNCINLKLMLCSSPLPLPRPRILRMIHLQTAAAGRDRTAKSNVAHHALRGT